MPETIKNEGNSVSTINTLIHQPARLKIMIQLYVVDSLDYVFLVKQTGLTWGNIATHIEKLELEKYVQIEKRILTQKNKKQKNVQKLQTILRLTKVGRLAFDEYRNYMKNILLT